MLKDINKFSESQRRLAKEILKRFFVLFAPNIFSSTAGNNEEKHNTLNNIKTNYTHQLCQTIRAWLGGCCAIIIGEKMYILCIKIYLYLMILSLRQWK